MARKLNFKSRNAYLKWLRFGQWSGVFKRTPGNTPVSIRGRKVKVNHKARRRKGRQ